MNAEIVLAVMMPIFGFAMGWLMGAWWKGQHP